MEGVIQGLGQNLVSREGNILVASHSPAPPSIFPPTIGSATLPHSFPPSSPPCCPAIPSCQSTARESWVIAGAPGSGATWDTGGPQICGFISAERREVNLILIVQLKDNLCPNWCNFKTSKGHLVLANEL